MIEYKAYHKKSLGKRMRPHAARKKKKKGKEAAPGRSRFRRAIPIAAAALDPLPPVRAGGGRAEGIPGQTRSAHRGAGAGRDDQPGRPLLRGRSGKHLQASDRVRREESPDPHRILAEGPGGEGPGPE